MMAGGITTFFDTPLTLSHPRAMANDCLPERAGALGIVVQFDVPRNVSYTLTATPMGGAGPLELVLFDGDCIDVGNRCQTSAGTDPLEIVSSKTNEHPKDYVVVELRSFGEGGTVQLQLTR